MREAEEALDVLALDRTSATLLVSEETEIRHFIAESLLIAAGLFLLQRYATGFLRGLGLDDLAEQHGNKSRDLLKKIRSSGVEGNELELLKAETGKLIREVRACDSKDSAEAQKQGEAKVRTALVDEGAPAGKASEIAARASLAVKGES
jgi:hypothetical protein